MLAHLTALAGIAGAAVAQPVEINFDDLASNTIVTNQYPEATFSSVAGVDNMAFGFATADTPPNILCTPGCLEDTYVDFTNPVNDLSFWAIEANVAGVTAQFNVFENGALSGTVDLVSSGGIGNNEFVDLSSFSNVTRVEIVNILNDAGNENGIGWDTFRFTVIPAPGALAAIALALIFTRRR
ncbi:MAG TPA: hypothetical protein VFF69_08270 [Phycisphaerales bacterium]|nr:hypothetical protein [Phycisphaerales bacterium]